MRSWRGKLAQPGGSGHKDPLEERAEDLQQIRHFVDETSFGGDERPFH